jgi:hypothetical protein
MKKDKILQHQLARLRKLLESDKAKGHTWGQTSTWGDRVVWIYRSAILRSIERFAKSL